MKILLLCEGDAESWDAWSGSAKSIVDHLRAAGQQVETRDVDLYGRERYLGALESFSPQRQRWGVKFHFLSQRPFERRSRRAEHHLREKSADTDVILQIGATFESRGRGDTPYALYCDSNIAMARRGAETGFTDAVPLSGAELDAIARREKRVYDGAAVVFTLSERLRRSFIEDFGLPDDRVVAVHAGPNLRLGAQAAAPADPGRAPGRTVLFVGRRFERKGGDLLLEAFARLRGELPDARLRIAGPREPLAEQPGVEWLGDLDKAELIDVYRSSDVFCLPTRFEPYGIAFLEAMHLGLPCVGTDAWAVPEMIADGETGLLVAPDDVDGLCDRLLRLLREPETARRMGEAGRERAVRLFTWERSAARIVDALEARGLGRR